MPRRFETSDDQALAGALLEDWQAGTAAADRGWKTYACKLVTPLYGGGVIAGEVDREMPIRTASLRGQLRFWWRVACGPFRSSAEMFERECALWGGIGPEGPTASRVAVRVRTVALPRVEPAFRYLPNPKKPGELKSFPVAADWAEPYALFSAQGKVAKDRRHVEEEPKALAQAGLTFDLGIRFSPDLADGERDGLEQALRWWASFGGVGARTRRGLGSLQVADLKAVTVDEVTARGGQLALRKPVGDAGAAWKMAVGVLKDFRQGLHVGRNKAAPGSLSPAGRSLWPEADTLRKLAQRADPRHSKRLIPVDAFPRSAFGLPIVFHFKDEKTGDPGDHVLEPADSSPTEKRDRLASPLILGPYWDGSRWRPAALLLPKWQEAIGLPLKLKDKPYTPAPWPNDPDERHALAQQIPPLGPRGDDALSAFLSFFTEE